MTPAARLSAAIEVLVEIFNRYQPSTTALKEWGRTHRFAGSSDRAIIGNLVFDVMRRKGTLTWLMDSDEPRALVLALYAQFWANLEALDQLCTNENHAPAPLSDKERTSLSRKISTAPPHVQGFYPEWLDARLTAIYGNARIAEGSALAERAPVDLRVNTLKNTRDKVLNQLQRYGALPCKYSPFGIRIPYDSAEARAPHVETEGVYQRGHVELQDEGSQVVSRLAGAKPGDQVADLCAGAGGKTLALAALMENKGQIISTDLDRHRLAPIYERIKRAGVHNVQVGSFEALDEFKTKMDKVVLDVPCTGTGAWRRRPDNKWRLSEKHIADRITEQDNILQKGAQFVRPGGELIYITCSILSEENEHRIAVFLSSQIGQDFTLIDMKKRWQVLFPVELPQQPPGMVPNNCGLRFSPYSSETDGFYIAILQKHA
jgi:16S rRNA (cytosine967-C5)-methyltransferase